MDPLTAFSLAGTIIQFVDFGKKLFSGARTLYESTTGALTANEELELVLIDLRAIITKLKQSPHPAASTSSPQAFPLADHPQTFQKICEGTLKVAEEIVERLDTLKVKDGKNRAWGSLQKAVKSAWSKSEMEDLKRRLASFKAALDTGLISSIR
jgi:hypothetical protein